MANYLTTDTELTSIANAIRTKGGTQAQLTYPTGFVSAINDIPTGGGTKPDIVLTGEQAYRFQGSNGVDLINAVNFTTSGITNTSRMFENYGGTTIPFNINLSSNVLTLNYMFSNARLLTTLPTIDFSNATLSSGNMGYMFYNCFNLTTIPDGYFSTLDFTGFHNSTANIGTNMFQGCNELTHIDSGLLQNLYCGRTNANV